MKSENVKERPLTKLDEYAILISKHWKRSKTGADDYDPTSILVNFKKDIKEVIKNELISDGWTKPIWHKLSENDLPTRQGQKVWLYTTSKDYFMANYYDDTSLGGKQFFEVASAGSGITLSNVLAWAELPKYEDN